MGEGTVVRYTDEHSTVHNAIINRVWKSIDGKPTYINLVYVTDDENKTDAYGHQIERATSVPVLDDNNVAGRHFELI